MTTASDAEHLIAMITLMTLWIINDYEDADLKERCGEIVENLEKLRVMLKQGRK